MAGLESKTAASLISLMESGEIRAQEIMEDVLKRIDDVEPDIQAYLSVRSHDELMEEARKIDEKRDSGIQVGPLAGLPIAIKDNISTCGIETTCASQILRNFNPVYDATVIERLREADAIVIGKTNLDEFAMGSSTEHSCCQITKNPWNRDYVPGGSSGGSAAAVAADECIFALGSDTGGSIRQPAAFCGVVGIKPTYGRVSRYGLVAFASSLDQIGPIAKSVEDSAILLQSIAGHDACDSTSVDRNVPDYRCLLRDTAERELRIGICNECFAEGLDESVAESVRHAIGLLERDGATLREISLPSIRYAIPAYYLVSSSEASSNLARYDGVAFGQRASGAKDVVGMIVRTRSQFFGDEVKLRIMMGTYALSAGYYDEYYLTAMKARSTIANDFKKAFEECDVIIYPVTPTTAYRIGEKVSDPLAMYMGDIYTVLANLAGVPAMSIPCATNQEGLPIGVQITANHFDETTMLQTAYRLECLLAEDGAWPERKQ